MLINLTIVQYDTRLLYMIILYIIPTCRVFIICLYMYCRWGSTYHVKGGGLINQFNPATFLCLWQTRTCMSTSFVFSEFNMRRDCLFCWYQWNCWQSPLKLCIVISAANRIHNNKMKKFSTRCYKVAHRHFEDSRSRPSFLSKILIAECNWYDSDNYGFYKLYLFTIVECEALDAICDEKSI